MVASGARDMGRPRKEEGERRATRWARPERDARGRLIRADAAAQAGPKIQEERGKEKRKNFSFFFLFPNKFSKSILNSNFNSL